MAAVVDIHTHPRPTTDLTTLRENWLFLEMDTSAYGCPKNCTHCYRRSGPLFKLAANRFPAGPVCHEVCKGENSLRAGLVAFGASCASQPAHRGIDGPDRSPACSRQARA